MGSITIWQPGARQDGALCRSLERAFRSSSCNFSARIAAAALSDCCQALSDPASAAR